VIAAVVVVLQLIAPGLVIFDLAEWDVEQLAFIEVFVVALSGLLGAFFARSKVTPAG
jgi:hypothetical protein